MSYTFGDNEQASQRLRRLSEIYEPETRGLLEIAIETSGASQPRLAVDLGCGPGWSTQLLATVLQPRRTVGLESSDRYIAEARVNHPHLEFLRHDILQAPFPVNSPELLFCRFLLTHLPSPQKALHSWALAAAPQATLLIHETEGLESAHPALRRYYELVAQMQHHYGQILHVGAILDISLEDTGWQIIRNRILVLEKSARDMAQLHLPNLRNWRMNEYAVQAFDRHELDELEAALDSIASAHSEAGFVRNTARQIVATKL